MKLLQVEGFEFDVLVAMVNGDDAEKRVHLPDQIVVELHTASRMYDLPWMLRFRQEFFLSIQFDTVMKNRRWRMLATLQHMIPEIGVVHMRMHA